MRSMTSRLSLVPTGRRTLCTYPHSNHSIGRVCDFVGGYLVGLSRELKPAVEKHIAWMESEPEPDRAIYMEHELSYEGWLELVI